MQKSGWSEVARNGEAIGSLLGRGGRGLGGLSGGRLTGYFPGGPDYLANVEPAEVQAVIERLRAVVARRRCHALVGTARFVSGAWRNSAVLRLQCSRQASAPTELHRVLHPGGNLRFYETATRAWTAADGAEHCPPRGRAPKKAGLVAQGSGEGVTDTPALRSERSASTGRQLRKWPPPTRLGRVRRRRPEALSRRPSRWRGSRARHRAAAP